MVENVKVILVSLPHAYYIHNEHICGHMSSAYKASGISHIMEASYRYGYITVSAFIVRIHYMGSDQNSFASKAVQV